MVVILCLISSFGCIIMTHDYNKYSMRWLSSSDINVVVCFSLEEQRSLLNFQLIDNYAIVHFSIIEMMPFFFFLVIQDSIYILVLWYHMSWQVPNSFFQESIILSKEYSVHYPIGLPWYMLMMLKLSVEMIVQKESRPRSSKALQQRMKKGTPVWCLPQGLWW